MITTKSLNVIKRSDPGFGTTIEKSEKISDYLNEKNIKHNVLNINIMRWKQK